MIFDPTINFGTVLSVLSFLAGGLYVASSLRADLKSTSSRVDRIEAAIEAMEKLLAVLAVQEDRLNAFARRLERMEGKMLGLNSSA